jgi:SAM-dependent methyltransferase
MTPVAETSARPRYAALEKTCYACIVFLSAFLLFQVQPIIAKMILPWFGGSSAVWNTCMLFFQGALLGGYLYAHWLHSRLTRFRQAAVHTALLAASLAVLPIIPKASWRPAGAASPSWHILALLVATIGLPYFLLSTTSPLMQAWYARSVSRGAMPYRLFALSNLASMLALLSYPPLVEPNLTTHAQAVLWSVAYASFVVLCGAVAWLARVPQAFVPVLPESDTSTNAPAARRLLWAALAACASILLLSITTYLTQDVAPIPFLWILPLSVYLLSFIICFEAPRLYWRPLFLPLLPIALGFTTYRLWKGPWGWDILPTIALMVASLFVFSMVCHGELASLKPHPRYLTGFYLMVALGGAMGGLFVALIAPNVFHAYHEFPIGLGLVAALAIAVQWARLPARPAILRYRAVQGILIAVLAGYFVCLYYVSQNDLKGARVVARNFYGRLTVQDDNGVVEDQAVRKLLHGVIDHGHQPLAPELRRQPSSYFCPESGIGVAMHAKSGGPRRVGILGLGCGTLMAYGRAGDVFRVYEINPLVVRLASTEFTYWQDSRATVQLVMGDGRLSLEREPSQQFDLLVMDAFSGDSVPVHLITTEAFRTYFRHLKPDGILAVNISNRYLDLKPVMERAATALGKAAMAYEYYADEDENYLCYDCTWALIFDPAVRRRYPVLGAGTVLPPNPGFRPWTDDFSDMRRIIR